MKKIFLILVFAFAITAVIGTASATVKCVPLGDGNQTTCTSNPGLYELHADWAAECTTNGVTSEITGIAACSNQQPASCGTRPGCDWTYADRTMRQQTITTSGNANENKYCWCKMTTPAVSRWVFVYDSRDAGSCAMDCASDCAKNVYRPDARGAAFRSTMFSGMTD